MRIKIFGRIIYLPRAAVIAICAVIIVIIVIIGYFLTQKNKKMPDVTPNVGDDTNILQRTNEITHEETPNVPKNTPLATIFVHITGHIVNEGVYELPADSRVEQLVQNAGGLTNDADTKVINLAMKLIDGMHIHVPGKYDQDKTWVISQGSGGSGTTEQSNAKININTAGVDELMTLSGVGESTAKSIVKYRETNGFFKKIEDIMNVPGIKEAKYAQFCDRIVV